MNRAISFDPRALAEADAAAAWFEEKRAGYGRVFRTEFDNLLDRLRAHAEMYQTVRGRVRRAFLHRFPFVVVNQISGDVVQVIGVLPTQADPALLSLLSSIHQ